MIIDVLTAFVAVTAVGLILAVLLAFAANFLHVQEDETVQKLRDALPGVNCGACGYTGCDDYAKALATGEVKTNLCIPGADATAEKVSEILGVDAEDVVEMYAYVHCNGNCEATSKKAVYEGIDSCRAAAMFYGGPDACRFGCTGFGDCAKVCPVDAICIEDNIARVDTRKCIGCGMCEKACPKGIIELVPQVANTVVFCSSRDKGAVARKACKNACIACKKCENNCPEGAIKVENNLARIDYNKCSGCGKCAEVCPTKCIKSVIPNVG